MKKRLEQHQPTTPGTAIAKQFVEPITEGINTSQKRPNGFFSRKSDVEMIEFAKGIIKDRGIGGRKELEMADSGLYRTLKARKLLERLGLQSRQMRVWTSMGKEGLIAHAKRFIAEGGIKTREALRKADSGMHAALNRRKLLDEAGLEEKQRDWAKIEKDELVAHVKSLIAENGITGKWELSKRYSGLYCALKKRKLLDELGFEDKHRDWTAMGRDELISHARMFIERNGITGRAELTAADQGLYGVLQRKGLLDQIGLEMKLQDWAGMSDEDIVGMAKGIIKEKGITSRVGLSSTHRALYAILERRQLLDGTGLQNTHDKNMHWESMGVDKLVEFARWIIAERRIRWRGELEKANPKLYNALLKRDVLDSVGIPKKRRDWTALGDKNLIEYSKNFIKENGIKRRKDFEKADPGLYSLLVKKRLMDEVFSEVGSSDHKEAVEGMLDAIGSFGDEK